ncbi:ABC-F family ATP-binding cassette domain-containing protein [Paenibacillus sp. 1P07SE]|uniref:ABC-F family ATP-binding cassette domain-containing protein n=1 Tax=Paenibacillus sp. 1P07SE TaxID=3132209 RepID=UPI0039A44BBF
MNVMSVENLSKSYGEKQLFADVSFGLDEGDKVGIIGVNGTGKSTLLKVIAGLDQPDSGRVVFGSSIRVQMLEQNPAFDPEMTVREHLFQGDSPELRALRAYHEAMAALELKPEDTGLQERMVAASQQIDALQAWELESEGRSALTRLGITQFDARLGTLSGGQRKRVAMAAALIQPSDVLILDEPTNHIDNESVAWLETMLQKRKGALLMITHDRYFLDRVSNRILELDRGRAYFYTANYSRFVELKLEREEREAATEAKRQNLLRNELAWIRRGAQARSTKQKARIERFEELQAAGPGRSQGKLDVSVASARLGKKIVEIEHAAKGYGDRRLIEDFSFIAVPEDRVGIVGRNGTGKSTLLKLIAGELEPDAGKVELGPTVKLGWFTQEHEAMDEQLRVIEYIREAADQVRTGDGTTISASQMLERFLFDSTMQWTPIAKLSGGEKRRLQLLRILMTAPNVLLLDEPTNDLDIATLTVLEDYLDEFPGVVFVVSHDRYFLDRTTLRILALEGDGRVVESVGNYSDYVRQTERTGSGSSGKGSSGSTAAAAPAAPAAGQAPARTGERGRALKMSYNEQKEYEVIDDRVAAAEQTLERIQTQMEQSASDSARLQELMQEQQAAEAELEELMDRWTYLSELAEKIAAQKQG